MRPDACFNCPRRRPKVACNLLWRLRDAILQLDPRRADFTRALETQTLHAVGRMRWQH